MFITCGQAQDKALRIIKKNDANGDGRISQKGWLLDGPNRALSGATAA
jgi:hypothetical protein